MDHLTQWMTIIKDIHNPEMRPTINKLIEKDGVFKVAYEEYSKINETDLMREKAEARQKFIWDLESTKAAMRREGKEEGKIEGKIEGKAEATQQIAHKMLTEGYDLETISNLTDLTIEQLQSLN